MARKDVEPMQIHVPIGARKRITDYSKKRGYPVYAEYIRKLIEADMQSNGEEIDLTVDRGGDRRPENE